MNRCSLIGGSPSDADLPTCWDAEIVMDLNYLFRRQQIERSLAQSANSDEARHAHEEMAQAYEQAIERKSHGQILFPWQRKRRR